MAVTQKQIEELKEAIEFFEEDIEGVVSVETIDIVKSLLSEREALVPLLQAIEEWASLPGGNDAETYAASINILTKANMWWRQNNGK
jgi:hypothetical protein